MQTDLWKSLSLVQKKEALAFLQALAPPPRARGGARSGKRKREGAAVELPTPTKAAVGVPAYSLNPAALSALVAATAASSTAGSCPAGTHFHAPVGAMAYATGDGPQPVPAAAVLLERDALAFVVRVLRFVRAVNGDRATVRLGDFASSMPVSLALYLRWKMLRGMAKAKEEEGVPAGGGEEEGGEGEEGGVPLVEEDEEERTQLALLQAQAEKSWHAAHPGGAEASADPQGEGPPRIGGTEASAPPAEGTAPSSAPPPDTGRALPLGVGPDIDAFRCRLAFANSRSSRLSTTGYAAFARAREVGFVGRAHSKAFASCVTPPALTRTVLEVLGYLAYDRIASIVEDANRRAHGGGRALIPLDPAEQLTPAALEAEGAGGQGGGGPCGPCLPLDAYVAALRAAPQLPPELRARAETLHTLGLARAAGEGLKAARVAEEERVRAENEGSRGWGGEVDAEGDAAFLSAQVPAGGGAAEAPRGGRLLTLRPAPPAGRKKVPS